MFSSDEKAAHSKQSTYAPTNVPPIPMPAPWQPAQVVPPSSMATPPQVRSQPGSSAPTTGQFSRQGNKTFEWQPQSSNVGFTKSSIHTNEELSRSIPLGLSTPQPSATRPQVTTDPLPGSRPTRKLTRPLTYIPAPTPKARQTRKLEHKAIPQGRSRLSIISTIGVVVVILLTIFISTPLGGSNTPLFQGVGNFILANMQGASSISQHIATPTPTPALTTLEGSCNSPYMGLWGICATAVTESGVMGTGEMQRPMKSEGVTQPFGSPEYQTWCGCVKPHTGIDLAATGGYGTPVLAADDGQVIWADWDWSGLGNAVKINHGRYIATVYGHLASFIVKVGQNVKKGDVIAYEGSTGASSGPHVHFMVVDNNSFKDPTKYLTLP